MWANLPIATPYEPEITASINPSITVNMFLIEGGTNKKPGVLAQYAGTELKKNFDAVTQTLPLRQLFVFGSDAYAIAADQVYRLDPSFTENNIGTVDTDQGYASFTSNNARELMIVAGSSGYTYDVQGGTFAQITAPGFPTSPGNGVFFRERGVVVDRDSNKFFISGTNDFTSWALGDFGSVRPGSGNLVGAGVVADRLFLFKTDKTQVWWDSGNADFPFRPITNMVIDYGCAAIGSIASEEGFLMWLGTDSAGAATVLMSRGDYPKPVSTPPIENVIRQLEDVSDARAYFYKNENGHLFYVINFTLADITLCYDLTLNFWSKLERWSVRTFDKPEGGPTRHIGDCYMFFANQHYIGSYNAPNILTLSNQLASNEGNPMVLTHIFPLFYDQAYKRIQTNRFQVDFQAGISPKDGIYDDAQAYLSVAIDNGGVDFGNKIPMPLGKLAQRWQRQLWFYQSVGREYAFKIEVFASVRPLVMRGAAIQYEVLPV